MSTFKLSVLQCTLSVFHMAWLVAQACDPVLLSNSASTFGTSGPVGPYSPPIGTEGVEIHVWGAGGSGSWKRSTNSQERYNGGGGGYVWGSLRLNSSDTLTLEVGAQGAVQNIQVEAFPDGGSVRSCSDGGKRGGGGGGSSRVIFNNQTLLVAGGGGGGGCHSVVIARSGTFNGLAGGLNPAGYAGVTASTSDVGVAGFCKNLIGTQYTKDMASGGGGGGHPGGGTSLVQPYTGGTGGTSFIATDLLLEYTHSDGNRRTQGGATYIGQFPALSPNVGLGGTIQSSGTAGGIVIVPFYCQPESSTSSTPAPTLTTSTTSLPSSTPAQTLATSLASSTPAPVENVSVPPNASTPAPVENVSVPPNEFDGWPDSESWSTGMRGAVQWGVLCCIVLLATVDVFI